MSKSKESLKRLRHLAMLLLACAVKKALPDVEPIQGSVSEIGFTYDFFANRYFEDSILAILEDYFLQALRSDLSCQSLDMMRENAAVFLSDKRQPIQAQLALCQAENIIKLHQIGQFFDTSPGDCLEGLHHIRAAKLLEMQMIELDYPGLGLCQILRITGTAFEDRQSLNQFLKRFSLAKKREPLLLLDKLQLGFVPEEKSEQCCVLLPRGYQILHSLRQVGKALLQSISFQEMSLPLTGARFSDQHMLPETRLHKEVGTQSTFGQRENELFERYKYLGEGQFPIKFVQWQQYYDTNVQKKDCCSLFNLSSVWQDQGIIACLDSQLERELIKSLDIFRLLSQKLGFEPIWHLTIPHSKTRAQSRDRKLIQAFESALAQENIEFYKEEKPFCSQLTLEMKWPDFLGRLWTISMVSIDLTAIKNKHSKVNESSQNPNIFLKHSLMTSMERVIGLVLEKGEGELPVWLMPEQIRICPLEGRHFAYSEELKKRFSTEGIRVMVDTRSLPISKKIYEAFSVKVPAVAIIGDRECLEKAVSVRYLDLVSQREGLISSEEFMTEWKRVCHCDFVA